MVVVELEEDGVSKGPVNARRIRVTGKAIASVMAQIMSDRATQLERGADPGASCKNITAGRAQRATRVDCALWDLAARRAGQQSLAAAARRQRCRATVATAQTDGHRHAVDQMANSAADAVGGRRAAAEGEAGRPS